MSERMFPPPPQGSAKDVLLMNRPPPPNHMVQSASVNLSKFEQLVEGNDVDLKGASIKEAYQHYKRLESQRQRNGQDARPVIVLSVLKEQLNTFERRRSEGRNSFRGPAPIPRDSLGGPPNRNSLGGPEHINNRNSLSLPPNRDSFGGPEQINSRNLPGGSGKRIPFDGPEHVNNRNSLGRPVNRNSFGGAEQMNLPGGAGRRNALDGPGNRPGGPASRNNRNSLGGVEKSNIRDQLQQSLAAAHQLVRNTNPATLRRRNSEILTREKLQDPQKRNTITGRPPPPSVPPPKMLLQGRTRSERIIPLPKHTPPPVHQLEEESSNEFQGLLKLPPSQPKVAFHDTITNDREKFVLRERLTGMENEIEQERAEKKRLKEHLLQLEGELKVSETKYKETKEELETLQQVTATRTNLELEQKEKIKKLGLEQKTASRKSRQRYDAAIDFMKGMLVDAKFENLVQVIKSRLKMIIGAEKTEVYIVDNTNNELLSYRERTGTRKPLPSGSRLWMGRFPLETGIVGAVIEDKEMQVVKDVENDTRFDALVDGIGSNGVRNLIVYPILMRHNCVAVIVVANKLGANGRITGDDFLAADIAAVQDFATLSTLAFLQKEIQKTRKQASTKDDSDHESGDEGEEKTDPREGLV